MKKILTVMFALLALACWNTAAFASDTVEINENGEAPEALGVVVGYQDNDLFSNMKEMMPGDTRQNQATIANRSSKRVKVYLKAYENFTAQDAETAVREESTASAAGKQFNGSILDVAKLSLKLGGRTIYEGSADGVSPEAGSVALTEGDYGILLGEFSAGQIEQLDIQLYLPGDLMGNEYQDCFDAVDWVFRIETDGEATEPSNPTNPTDPTSPSEGTGSIGGTGGSGSSGGSGGGSGSSGSTSAAVIQDQATPLGEWTGGDGDVNLLIADSDVPLGMLPKLGDQGGTAQKVLEGSLVLLAACLGWNLRKYLKLSRRA